MSSQPIVVVLVVVVVVATEDSAMLLWLFFVKFCLVYYVLVWCSVAVVSLQGSWQHSAPSFLLVRPFFQVLCKSVERQQLQVDV